MQRPAAATGIRETDSEGVFGLRRSRTSRYEDEWRLGSALKAWSQSQKVSDLRDVGVLWRWGIGVYHGEYKRALSDSLATGLAKCVTGWNMCVLITQGFKFCFYLDKKPRSYRS